MTERVETEKPETEQDGTGAATIASKLSGRVLPESFLHWGMVAFVTISILAVFVPFNPEMPDKGITPEWISAMRRARSHPEEVVRLGLAKLDESWVLAVNTAAARHMRFGKDVVFTFGPYGSIYTRAFHPGTDHLMIWGSLLLALAYEIAVLYLARARKWYAIVALVLFCVTFPPRDALFLSFPFLLIVCALQMTELRLADREPTNNWTHILGMGICFAALGLLPLIKGSLVIPVAFSVIVLGLLLWKSLPAKETLFLLFVFPIAMLSFWIISGQSLSNLPAYFRTMMWLTSGYVEAMSTPWINFPAVMGAGFIVAYLAISAVLLFSVVRGPHPRLYEPMLLACACLFFLMIAFKLAFIRTDHVELAFQSVALFALILSLIRSNRYLLGAVVVAMLLTTMIAFRQDQELKREVQQAFGTGTATGKSHGREVLTFVSKRAFSVLSRVTYKAALDSYAELWHGLYLRVTDGSALRARFQEALATIRDEYHRPPLKGGVDIYTYEQALLIASDDVWDPRPVFQSYSAYTPQLATLNERHLRGANAPEWILMDLVDVDKRFPSLDDGLSWPALLDNYRVDSYDGQFAFLRKNQVTLPTSKFDVVSAQTQAIGRIVVLPQATVPMFAEITLKPTMLGRLLNLSLHDPELNLTVCKKNGECSIYRVVAEMMQTGFVLSPLVRNTADFVSLVAGDKQFEADAQVQNISLAPVYGGSILWQNTYVLTLKTQRSDDTVHQP